MIDDDDTAARLRPINAGDLDRVLALNNLSAAETSLIDRDTLEAMLTDAFLAVTADRLPAFLIAFDERAGYRSPNFLWFKARHRHFVYVDRIVVGEAARGRGLARSLYRHLFAVARAGGHDLVTCEVNSRPPNPVSEAFHAAMGFREVGTGTPQPGKEVAYLERPLAPDEPD
ncbi:MAG: GNAT family N-acetyltransferase [Hyphomicrobiaceae bacterium]